MDRRKFIGALAALGFAGAFEGASASSLFAASPAKAGKAGRKCHGRFDDNLVVLLSDMHTNPDGYQPDKCRRVIADILAMKPLPRNVVTFGDLAYLTGKPEEYALAKEIFAPLEEAGIKVTHGMGNHDRRETFAAAFPDKAAESLFPGRMVFKVETLAADILMLDSLQQGEDDSKWITPGALGDGQIDWLRKTLETYPKPVFVASHHPLEEVGIGRMLLESPACCGYIHGHNHVWRPSWIHKSYKNVNILRTLCLPSTGHWGDIGYTTFRISENVAVAQIREYEFFFPNDQPVESSAQWGLINADNDGAVCTFTLKRQ